MTKIERAKLNYQKASTEYQQWADRVGYQNVDLPSGNKYRKRVSDAWIKLYFLEKQENKP